MASTNGVTMSFGGYDGLGNVGQSSEQVGSNTYPFAYRYNLASELVAEQYPSNRVLTMSYDQAGRALGISGKLGTTTKTYVSGVSYAPQGAPAQYSYGNGVARVMGYNARLEPATAVDGTGLSGMTIANPLLSSTWNWNFGTGGANQNNGNLAGDTTVHSGGGLSGSLTFAHSFSYDAVNRLTSASEGSNWKRGFNYDFWGNSWVDLSRTSGIAPAGNTPTSNVFNSATNRISSGAYDAAGNQTGVNGNTLTYDAEGRVRLEADSGGSETILYDGAGTRVEKNLGGVLTVYVYDAFGTLAAQYASGATVTAACTTCYLSADQVGSTRLVTNQTGAVVARHDYLPFGEEITTTGGRTTQWGSTTDVPHKFTGQLRDTESAMDFFNTRYYGYALNRFTSPDPANAGADPANPQSWNGYAYVINNPMSNVDPSGLDCVTFDNGSTGDDGQGTACPGSQTSQTTDVNGGNYAPVDTWAWWWDGGWRSRTGTVPAYGNGGGVAHFTAQGTSVAPRSPQTVSTPQNNGTNNNCVAGYGAAGATAGAGVGWLGGGAAAVLGAETGPADIAIAYGGKVLTSAVGTYVGQQAGQLIGSIICSSSTGAGGGSGLTPGARKKLGNLISRAGERVRDVIRSRGGTAANVKEAGQWADKTLGETAQAAANGDPTAETAIKIAKQAGRLGQIY